MNASNTTILAENSVERLAASIADSAGPLLPMGARTKSALSACDENVTMLDMRQQSGIVTYDPSEFLITAQAGTPISVVQAALDEQEQYLPFDPMFAAQGATLGGTVASGLSGAGRLLYGSLRDFVMEVQLIDGLGKLVRGGGKVVKNAAGFDLPKLVVGSYGRLGVLTELTLKVFPRPPACATLSSEAASLINAIHSAQALLAQPLPITALDFHLERTGHVHLIARFAAHADSLAEVLRRAEAACRLPAQAIYEPLAERRLWLKRAETIESPPAGKSTSLVRIATTLPILEPLVPQLLAVDEAEVNITGGGSVAWLSLSNVTSLERVDQILAEHKLPAIVIRLPNASLATNGVSSRPLGLQVLGNRSWLGMAQRIQKALDPLQKFVPFDSRH